VRRLATREGLLDMHCKHRHGVRGCCAPVESGTAPPHGSRRGRPGTAPRTTASCSRMSRSKRISRRSEASGSARKQVVKIPAPDCELPPQSPGAGTPPANSALACKEGNSTPRRNSKSPRASHSSANNHVENVTRPPARSSENIEEVDRASIFHGAQKKMLQSLDSAFEDAAVELEHLLLGIHHAEEREYEVELAKERRRLRGKMQEAVDKAVSEVLEDGPDVEALRMAGADVGPAHEARLRRQLDAEFDVRLEDECAKILREKEASLLQARDEVAREWQAISAAQMTDVMEEIQHSRETRLRRLTRDLEREYQDIMAVRKAAVASASEATLQAERERLISEGLADLDRRRAEAREKAEMDEAILRSSFAPPPEESPEVEQARLEDIQRQMSESLTAELRDMATDARVGRHAACRQMRERILQAGEQDVMKMRNAANERAKRFSERMARQVKATAGAARAELTRVESAAEAAVMAACIQSLEDRSSLLVDKFGSLVRTVASTAGQVSLARLLEEDARQRAMEEEEEAEDAGSSAGCKNCSNLQAINLDLRKALRDVNDSSPLHSTTTTASSTDLEEEQYNA
jgi:hypothetical protein